ncbi:MAG: hypothetical protein ACLQT7_08300 [Candidatus Dormibacteria bacterium]
MAISSEEEESQTLVRDRLDPGPGGRRVASASHVDGESPVVRAAERLVQRIETLVQEITRLRADNDDLRHQIHDALAMFERASSVAGETRSRRRGAATEAAVAAPGRRRKPRGRLAKGRATPPEVTTEVVRAVIAKLGQGTAAEIASEITRAGVKVSGRAVRFLAERAGAETFRGDDGQRRYRLHVG